jgi:LPPG:FO 2-phospho-L-lactate transferase
MSDDRVRTRVLTAGGWRGLQEYLILDRGEPEVRAVELEGIETARPTPEVLGAIAEAEAILIGPSNPVISIGPILALAGVREAIAQAAAPVVGVSPYVAGQVVKGPTERFMQAVGRPSDAAGVASLYEGLLDGMLVDEGDPDPPPAGLRTRAISVLMEGPEGRERVAREALDFATELRGGA